MKTIPLHGVKARGRVALVDDEDYELVMQYKWILWEEVKPGRAPSGPYAFAYTGPRGRRMIRMHILITGAKGIDHIDRDGLNNQRYNLRHATKSQNMWNTRPRRGTSRFKGVSWYAPRGNWRAVITAHRSRYFLGYFDDEEAAARAWDAAARKYHGEFAYQNFPSTGAEQCA